MGFRSIRTFQFRNLADAETVIAGPEVFFVGENGQGKTNILEAIYLLCFGTSFRTHTDSLLIHHGASEMAVEGRFAAADATEARAASGSREMDSHGPDNRVLFKYQAGARSGGKKEIRVNEKLIKDRKELVSNIPCIIFSHEDISFVSGPPERRRWFFNQTMSLYEPLFIDLTRRYHKIVKLRNFALKERRQELLEIYDTQLAETGLEIVLRRERTTREFNRTFERLFRDISGIEEELSVHYHPSWRGCETVEQVKGKLAEKANFDFEMGTTTTGPHRDRFVFTLERRNFARIASTGQLRLMSLILRVAQASYYTEKTGRRPVLLLDDVLLELDMARRERFLHCLPDADQRFFTFLPDEQYRRFVAADTVMYKVEKGVIIRQ